MKIKRCAIKVSNAGTGIQVWLADFLDVDHKVPLFSIEPRYFPVRLALDYYQELRRCCPIVKIVPMNDGSIT